jgi:hemerythrin-like domain-containing protein
VKRSEALAPLSRDHHVALEAALRLRRATAEDVDAAVARFAAFWSSAGARHFEIEEQLILPALPEDDSEWAAAVAWVRAEHAEIRARAGALERDDVDAARALGELLAGHVRYEERVLFAQLERTLDDERLAALGAAVEAAERR